MLDLFEELDAITAALSNQGIAYALIGGMAYSFYVELRATEDIDFLIPEDQWPRIMQVLMSLGYEDLAGPMQFNDARILRLTKLAGEDVMVLDFVLADEVTMPGVREPVLYPFRSRTIPLAPVEVLMELKRRRLSRKDQLDLEGLQQLVNRRSEHNAD